MLDALLPKTPKPANTTNTNTAASSTSSLQRSKNSTPTESSSLPALTTQHAQQSSPPRHSKDYDRNVEDAPTHRQQELHREVLQQLKQETFTKVNKSPTSAASTTTGRLSVSFRGAPARPASRIDSNDASSGVDHMEHESPTVVLSETLQALERGGMKPDYYVERANNLVDLFQRYPTIKYDLVWPVFGPRVQAMLLSDTREVVAAGYRLTRYAIADRHSIQNIRFFHLDEVVSFSLAKDSRASMEREQALKFVRAFLDVKGGIYEISKSILRTLVSIAEHSDDRLHGICLLTLSEIMVCDPAIVYWSGGISVLSDNLASGTFGAPESLTASFLHAIDTPRKRQYLKASSELESVFAAFTDSNGDKEHKGRLEACAKAISAMLKTWQGLITLSRDGASPLRSVLFSLQYPDPLARDLILELLFDALRIKPPSWSSTNTAGNRFTTYGRVTNLRPESDITVRSSSSPQQQHADEDDNPHFDLTTHFSSLILATLVQIGLIEALTVLVEDENDLAIKRKATLLLTEVLRMAHNALPRFISDRIQLLPHLVSTSLSHNPDIRQQQASTSTIYQIESMNRSLMARSNDGVRSFMDKYKESLYLSNSLLNIEQSKNRLANSSMHEANFRNAILETHVLSSANYIKWRWDLIQNIIEGPLTNAKRLDEAIRGMKFMKRLVGFYRPFKRRFSMIKNVKANQRYIRVGCSLMRTLVRSNEGTRYLIQNKLVRQIAECLAQVDHMSGLTSSSPLFSEEHMRETLSGGYFALLGTLSSEPNGLYMMERWHMYNMFYHIIELDNRPDLVQALLGNMDYSLDSHLRIILSKASTTGTKEIRLFCTKLLRKYVVRAPPPTTGAYSSPYRSTNRNWVIKILVTQLYDTDISVCEVAAKILEEACNQRDCLECVVKCRPALDHLGEIGAPLLLRFLSTSVGYHYLDGLDYITQEMDDWFLGRNDAYVGLVEASLSRAYIDQPRQGNSFMLDDFVDMSDIGVVPPHFYRELARTTEGCRLLEQSGHFNEFATTIREFDLNEEDPEVLLKVKGCLWAVGNVASMELSAQFLEQTDIVGRIVEIAENAMVLTMRGTAFFVMGLVSRSRHGLEMLLEADWDVAVDQMGRSLGTCLPCDLTKLYSISLPCHDPCPAEAQRDLERYRAAKTDANPWCQEILNCFIDLGNTILAKRAANDLNVLRHKYPSAFSDISLFRKVQIILEGHHYRLQIRRFALDLFDRDILRQIVLEPKDETPSASDRSVMDASDSDAASCPDDPLSVT